MLTERLLNTQIYPIVYLLVQYTKISLPTKKHILLFQRVHLDIQVGEHAIDYQQIQAKDKLTELQLRIRQLLDQVEQVTKEQNYQRVSITTCRVLTVYPRVGIENHQSQL